MADNTVEQPNPIESIEQPSEVPDAASTVPPQPPSQPPPIEFACHRCGMHQQCHYHGDSPPFAPAVRLAAEFYVKRNPFAPPPNSERPSAEYYLLMGGDCAACGRAVCRGSACSVFYAGRTMCLGCAEKGLVEEFPLEMRTKINRALVEARQAAADE